MIILVFITVYDFIFRDGERVINEKRKITGGAYGLIMIFLLISMLVKQFIFQSEFNEYAVEFIAFFGASIYIVISNIFVGNNLYRENKKNYLL